MAYMLRPDLPKPYPFTVSDSPCTSKLDQNELGWDVPTAIKGAVQRDLTARSWNRYVQPGEYFAAKAAVADVVGVDPTRIALTVGADQAIEAAFMITCGPGRIAQWAEPTYPYIGQAALRTGSTAQPIQCGRDIDALTAAQLSADAALTVLVRPNNPSGGAVDLEVVSACLDKDRAVLVDEAYAPFCDDTVRDHFGDANNLLIARSCSKSGLAGAHLGYLIAPAEAVAAVERLYTAPYHLNAMHIAVACHYADIAAWMAEKAQLVKRERARIASALEAGGFSALPSHTNFVAFDCGSTNRADTLWAQLDNAGVRIRNLTKIAGLETFLRVTIGQPQENDHFLREIA